MNRHRVAATLAVSIVCAGSASAQPPERDASPPGQLSAVVRASITPERLEQQAAAIVRHERPSGSAGERAAIDHVVETLRADGVDVEVHTYQAYASTPVAASLVVVGSPFSPDAITYSFSAPADGLEAELIDGGAVRDIPALEPGTGERLVLAGDIDAPGTARSRYPDVTGAIVLVDGNPGRASLDRLAMLGAVGVVYAHLEERLNDLIVTSTWGTPSLRSYHRLPAIPAVHVRRSDGDALRARLEQGETRVRMTAEVDVGWRPHHLAVARIPAPDPDAPFVLFGGHIDSWYFGGTDEGASNAAMVELARAFHANRQGLRRGLVVAWWPGHSNARYGGSTWFADHYFDELRTRGVAYLNIDGMGQTGARRFGATTSAALGGLAADVVAGLTGEVVAPSRPGRNSDQSFNGVGLPLLQLNHQRLTEDGGYWWWHTPDDTFDKNDFDVLKTDTDLYADALARLLSAPRLPVDLVSQVAAMGAALERRAGEAGARFGSGRGDATTTAPARAGVGGRRGRVAAARRPARSGPRAHPPAAASRALLALRSVSPPIPASTRARSPASRPSGRSRPPIRGATCTGSPRSRWCESATGCWRRSTPRSTRRSGCSGARLDGGPAQGALRLTSVRPGAAVMR